MAQEETSRLADGWEIEILFARSFGRENERRSETLPAKAAVTFLCD